jgi:hypothetical protein
MRDWPPIDDPAVLEWLGLDDEGWRLALEERFRGIGPRPYDDAAYRHALLYPWERPAGSYVLREGEVALIADLDPDDRHDVVTTLAEGRHPLVAFGANGAPERLLERFGALDDPADRSVLVLTGMLHGVDVGAQASPTAFGTMPGALFASEGTAVRASVLWLTSRQLAIVTLAELGYRLGRLDHARFVMDDEVVAVDDLFAYVSRIGALRIDGEPVALASVPATDRTARAMSQEELLDVMAPIALGPGARAPDLVRACFEDTATVVRAFVTTTWPDALKLPDDAWTPYPI